MKKNKDEHVGKKGRLDKKVLLLCVITALVVIVASAVWLVIGTTESAYMYITTPYVDLRMPAELEGVITNEVSESDGAYICMLYMNYDGQMLPLWQVVFGNSTAGEWVGTLKTDQGDIPVVMASFLLNKEQQSGLDEKGLQLYGECMQGYVVMLDGIMEDSCFISERLGEYAKTNLTYWSAMLPKGMTAAESTEGENYEAVFYGEVVGEMVRLYRVCIGEEQAESFLGYFEIDGVKKPVSVESFMLAERESWNEQNYATAYKMMDTINSVIDSIMQSEQFSTNAG